LAISLILHIVLLSQVNWKIFPAPTSDQHPLTVSLEHLPSTRSEKTIQDKHPPPAQTDISRFKEQAAKENNAEMIARRPERIEISNLVKPGNPVDRLDMNHLLKQAGEYAAKEYRISKPIFSLAGDYYGTYSGSDNGTFYVHLDSGGHASGSGQSGTFGIGFSIAGDATKDGLIQMSGTGVAGKARFKGQLNIKTGEISGSWLAANIGSGTFSGQRE